ncbi:transglycosylase SLT domain-containing protein [Methylobacterium sp. HMF5984]|uniref:transglycosylase SLT domain-containing protein n=1 Tax=unclassified Methylobacterium TaxID=2615210 RepID=UPI001FB9BE47|nr:transglycosylase SLT domain-containing protein [Methylobacterium sp. E-016]MCJ2075030.1 lytic transglycosylase domain-containing protein [Methylobacterium sp. E-016]
MGVFPEPALCADDVSRLVPIESNCEVDTVVWLPRAVCGTPRNEAGFRRPSALRRRSAALGLAALLAGFVVPQAAFAPAASAHDRIDERPRAAIDLASAGPSHNPSEWSGVPVIEQEPATSALIAGDLAALPQPSPETDDTIRFGKVGVPRRIVDTILKAAAAAGVDPVYLMALADKESSFATDVKAQTSSAEGLFQFVTATWLEMIRDFGARYGLDAEAAAVKGRGAAITVAAPMRDRVLSLRKDPYVAALMAAELIKRDRGRIEARVGRALTTSELYFAHFLGTSSAGRFLTMSADRPDEVAEREFRSAARANRALFTQKADKAAGKARRHLTVAEVYDRIDGMIDRRLSRYEGVAAVAAAVETAEPAAEPPAQRVQVTEALPPDGE